MARLFNDPFCIAIDGNGNPMPGALLYFYLTGTTTPKDTYTDSGLTTLNANPVVANAAGLFGPIYLATDAEYKVILKTSAAVTVATRDPLALLSTSVIGHEGSLIVGNALGADSELLINANADSTLRSTGTTVEWRRSNYTKQAFLSGSGTYTTPAKCTAIKVRVQAGGGGGGGTGGTTGPNGAAGTNSSFNSVVATGGGAGAGNATGTPLSGIGGAGGTGSTGTASFRIPGGDGGNADVSGALRAGGGGSHMGQGAPMTYQAAAAAGTAAKANSGGGGGGSSSPGTTAAASAGGGGEYLELHILAPSASYTYAVGGGGAGGIGTGTGAATGGAGGSGIVIVEEFYS